MILCKKARDGVVRDDTRDLRGDVGAVGAEPVGGPVQRAQKRAGRDNGIRLAEDAGAHPFRDERPDPPLVPIAFRHNPGAQAAGKRVDLEMRRAAFHFVEETQHVRFGQDEQPPAERFLVPPGRGDGGQQAVQRPVLAEKKQFVLPAKVVIQVARREVGGERDVAHAGGGEAGRAEDARCGAQNLDAARVGAA